MAKVKNQDIPAQDVIYEIDPPRNYQTGEAYQQAATEGAPLAGQPGQAVVRKSPKHGKPSKRGPGTAAQVRTRNCFALCGQMWRGLSREEKKCIKDQWREGYQPGSQHQIAPEGFTGPYSFWQKCCLSKCIEIGAAFYNPDCFNTCCGSPSIGYTSASMMVNESQQLTVVNGVNTALYEFEMIRGGGTVTPSGLYTAPASNPNCEDNATVGLFCYGDLQDEIELIINAWPTCAVANREEVCRTYGQCGGICYYRTYDCNGILVIPFPCAPGDLGVCSECVATEDPHCLQVIFGAPGVYTEAAEYYDCPMKDGDLRTEAMIAGGCCPPLL